MTVNHAAPKMARDARVRLSIMPLTPNQSGQLRIAVDDLSDVIMVNELRRKR